MGAVSEGEGTSRRRRLNHCDSVGERKGCMRGNDAGKAVGRCDHGQRRKIGGDRRWETVPTGGSRLSVSERERRGEVGRRKGILGRLSWAAGVFWAAGKGKEKKRGLRRGETRLG